MFHPTRLTNLTGDATPKQIEYVEAISTLLGLEIPAEKSKQEYSNFINKNVRKYKERLANDRRRI